MRTSENIQSQIELLERLLKFEPEKIGDKWNTKHFSLKGKIKKLQNEKITAKQYEFLAQ